MVMNKKEKQMMEDLKTLLALRFTEKVEPDIDIPKGFRELVNGYTFNSYTRFVRKSCSSSRYHGIGEWNKTTSQGPIKQYSTRLLALKALRHELEMSCAYHLRTIDLQIEKELEDGNETY